jgi:hypothetical protein
MLFLQPMPMDEVAAANRPVAAEVYTMKVCRTHTAAAWNDVLLAQAPGTPGSPSPRPGSGSLLEPPGSPAADTPVPPARPNNVNNGTSRSPFDTTGTPNDPGRDTPAPAVPEPVRPDAGAPGTPSPVNTPPPIDDTKAPGVPTTPTGTGGTSGPMQSPANQTPAPSSADPGAPSAAPTPSTPAPPASTTAPPATTTPPPTNMGASGTR